MAVVFDLSGNCSGNAGSLDFPVQNAHLHCSVFMFGFCSVAEV